MYCEYTIDIRKGFPISMNILNNTRKNQMQRIKTPIPGIKGLDKTPGIYYSMKLH